MKILRRFVIAALLLLSARGDAETVGGAISLTDHHGDPFVLEQLHGQVVILSFGYTFCPDICPTTLAIVNQAMHQLGDLAERVRPLFVSLDPERDTPALLSDYVAYFHPRLIGLTGSPEALREVADRYRVRYAFVGKGEREHYTLDHSASIYILDTEGRVARIVPYGLPADTIVDTVRALLSDPEPPG